MYDMEFLTLVPNPRHSCVGGADGERQYFVSRNLENHVNVEVSTRSILWMKFIL